MIWTNRATKSERKTAEQDIGKNEKEEDGQFLKFWFISFKNNQHTNFIWH